MTDQQTVDMAETVTPKSDQLNADDLMSGDRTFTIAAVSKGSAEQPVAVRLAELPDGRPYYPCKSMRRVMISAWGADASKYVGRRLTLYRDPDVKFGGMDVAGIRIRAMSHIAKPLNIALTVTRGKRAPYRVQPLPDEAPKASAAPLASRIEQVIAAFASGSITVDQLQARVGTAADCWTAEDVGGLENLFQALKRREVTKDAAFPPANDEADPDNERNWPKPGAA